MSSNSPCAACKCLRRKCTPECVFAPYFPPDNPQKFTSVHKVFGASNVSKILNELSIAQRREAVNSLAYEAEYRLKDPIYGCVGLVAILQNRLKQVQHDLLMAKKELATYIGPSAMLPMTNHHPGLVQQPIPMPMPIGIPHGAELMITEHQQQQEQQQFLEAQQLAAARERELLRSYAHQQQQQQQQQNQLQQKLHQHQQQLQEQYQNQPMHQQNYHPHQQLQNDLLRFNSGFSTEAGGSITATGFNQMNEYGEGGGSVTATGFNQIPVGSSYHNIQRQEPSPLTIQMQELFLEEQQQASLTNTQQQPTRSTKSDEERSIGPP